ncbi:DinB family protein [uncultured Arcticibacterium sp.]|uniref:DinB family protein n=1 Tax=uncultured Arcticibacterium sp. TaxID=2173042 RepID=UPI0030FCE784
MSKELEKIIDNLETVFRGDAWHGPSVLEMLNSLPEKVVDQKRGYSKRTIAKLIYHLVAWRMFIIEKLADNIHYTLETEEDNWGKPEMTSQENWQNLIQLFKDTQKKLVDLLEEQNDELLNRRVPGEHYDFYKLLTGMIQHDTYHLGMIWVLWE